LSATVWASAGAGLAGTTKRRGAGGAGLGAPAPGEVLQHGGEQVRVVEGVVGLCADRVGAGDLMQANRLLGDRAVDRALQDHPAVDGGVFGAGAGRDQDVCVDHGQAAGVLSGFGDGVAHPLRRHRAVGGQDRLSLGA
jgi:hypothetical protein